jgi:predicted small lipoprotein YifL
MEVGSQMGSFKSFRFKLCMFTLILLALTSLAACGQKGSEPPPPLTVEMLKNAEYHSEWPAKGVAKLTDGEYQEEIVPGAASKLVIVVYPDMYAFGDLNDDGVEDAAVVLATSGGGSGTFISLEAVINDEGEPKHLATALLGDRAQVKSVVIESGRITVDMVTHGPDDPMCCPTVETTQKYKLEGDTLIQISSED